MIPDKTVLQEWLIHKATYTPSYVENIINKHKLKGLLVYTSNRYNEKINDLSFLKEYKFLKGLKISGSYDCSFDFLPTLSRLTVLSIYIVDGKQPINLTHQTELKNCR